jgi:branched-chain amino acid transport system substrate-binding protein
VRKIYLLFLCFFLLAALSGCGGGEADTVKIGLIAELTGDVPAVGASCRNAAEMAVKEINDAGGLDLAGKKYQVKLYIEDNAGKADQSASAAQKLIAQQNVLSIVGPNASRYAIPASEVAESGKVVLITPWSTTPKTTLDSKTGAPKKYVFRACFTDPFQGRVLAKFAIDNLKL